MAIKIEKIMELGFPEDGITRYSMPCAKCLYALPPIKDISAEYFEYGAVKCLKCGELNDLWQLVLQSIGKDPDEDTYFDFVGLGAKRSTFQLELWRGQMQEINFTTLGVPQSAVILDANYTGNSSGEPSCLPMEIRRPFGKRFYKSKVQIYGMPFGNGTGSVTVWGSVIWIHDEDEAYPWLLLADAFEALAAFKYSRVLAPAHAAFEISLSRLIKQSLEGHASHENLNSFIVNALTAEHALNVFLPFLCAYLGIKPLPDKIRGKLNRLRSLRNKVVHDSLTDSDVKKKEVKELLCAAIFGFEFVILAMKKKKDQVH